VLTSGRTPAALPPLRFHDLRHTYGSLLVAGGIDLASVKSAMGHSRISTTERYLRARSASELADRFTKAFGDTVLEPAHDVNVRAYRPALSHGRQSRSSAVSRHGTGISGSVLPGNRWY
jgi:hypothetical protein